MRRQTEETRTSLTREIFRQISKHDSRGKKFNIFLDSARENITHVE